MEYNLYKLKFISGVHFGDRVLEDAEYVLRADTIFSAMCHELIKMGEDKLKIVVEAAKAGKLLLSDAFPYIKDKYYVPKPMYKVESKDNKGDSEIKKAYKKLSYIDIDKFDEYLLGNLDVKAENDYFSDNLGSADIKINASIYGEEETKPYRVGVFGFKENSGLYIIIGVEDENISSLVDEVMKALSYAGIGGRRSSGNGRFEVEKLNIPEKLYSRLVGDYKVKMSLSVSLPKEAEMENAIENAGFMLLKRSGFTSSKTYANNPLKKKDLYVLQSGSCFENAFVGDIYDVSTGETHPVYRYAKPMFMGVK